MDEACGPWPASRCRSSVNPQTHTLLAAILQHCAFCNLKISGGGFCARSYSDGKIEGHHVQADVCSGGKLVS